MVTPFEDTTPTVQDVDAPKPHTDGLGGHRPLLGTCVTPLFTLQVGSILSLLKEKEFTMVAARKVRKIVCCLVRVPAHPEQPRCHSLASGATPRHNQSRPSDLLPWADPYITQLVRNLQNEVRHERSTLREPALTTSPDSQMSAPKPDWRQATRTAVEGGRRRTCWGNCSRDDKRAEGRGYKGPKPRIQV